MYYRRQPTYLEIVTGIPCGVRESDVVTMNTTPTVNMENVSEKNLNKNMSENVRNRNASVRYNENGIEQVHTGLEYVGTSGGANGNMGLRLQVERQEEVYLLPVHQMTA